MTVVPSSESAAAPPETAATAVCQPVSRSANGRLVAVVRAVGMLSEQGVSESKAAWFAGESHAPFLYVSSSNPHPGKPPTPKAPPHFADYQRIP